MIIENVIYCEVYDDNVDYEHKLDYISQFEMFTWINFIWSSNQILDKVKCTMFEEILLVKLVY